ncbi:hypothetical protein EZV73_04750 [Acidaminobacter sp. JC074]|uniref:anti sigma factor C-terminal domain-containing protein n=1 Tax=Acidaminobacter sp. JC074 TaxID=2530199 RepID=UPI001F104D34|nr:anti sigma factor C-terminal domain-containing protein [Acidaminobacter sp. JC074]MCH4886863.1 hypothetical protein [Acidaminobacter sp. JC074]
MNDFKSLLEKYKKGQASDQEIIIVEEAIEKNKAINDYLAESIEDFSMDDIEDISVDLVHKKVKSKLRKNIILSVLIVMSIFVFANFILSPVMDRIYYDPTTVTYGQYHKDIAYDMAAFTELNVPGYKALNPLVIEKGYGSYDLVLRRKNLFEGFDHVALGDRVEIQLKRGKRQGYFDYLYGNGVYLVNDSEEFDYMPFYYETPLKELRDMHKKNYISVFLEPEESLELLDVVKLMDKETDLDYKWLSVKNMDLVEGRPIGFNPSISDTYSVVEEFDRERYPYFDLHEFFGDMVGSFTEDEYMVKTSEIYQKHFISLVNYLNDREDFVRLFGYNTYHYELYQETLDYVEKNGVKINGFLVYGEAEALVSFIENNDIKTIQILDVKTSKYSK